MLDLKVVGGSNTTNPAIIDLAVFHFDFSTGKELGRISTPIQLSSCIDHGLTVDEKWTEEHIPETLKASRSCEVTLSGALERLAEFIGTAHAATQEQFPDQEARIIVWGNGAGADNAWIASAFKACGMEKPWTIYNDMCLRTFAKEVGLITGRDYTSTNTQAEDRENSSVENCTSQIELLMATKKDLEARITELSGEHEILMTISAFIQRGDPSVVSQINDTATMLNKANVRIPGVDYLIAEAEALDSKIYYTKPNDASMEKPIEEMNATPPASQAIPQIDFSDATFPEQSGTQNGISGMVSPAPEAAFGASTFTEGRFDESVKTFDGHLAKKRRLDTEVGC